VQWLLALATTWIAVPPPGPLTALAEHRGTLLAGTALGLFSAGSAGWERTAVPGAVLDLAVGPDALWVATTRGLFAWAPPAEPQRVVLGAGARLRAVAVDAAGSVWVATESGAYLRHVGDPDFEREASLPPGDVVGLRTAGRAVFAARTGALWTWQGERFERLTQGLGDGWWELSGAAAWGDSVYLAVPSGLWRVRAGSAERLEPGVGEVRDVYGDASGLWVATSRGLWRHAGAPGLVAPAPAPLLDAVVSRLLAAGNRLLAASDRGIAELRDHGPAAARAAAAAAPPEPDVQAVHAVVLSYLDLAPGVLRQIEQRARRRAWLPRLRAAGSTGSDHSRDHDHDQAFTAGELHNLYDTHDARDRGVAGDLEIAWDFGQLADPADALAVSRERRLVVELRDQVLDRVNRLYFERLRARDALAAASDAAKQRELELRVAELTAQLDAWSGGGFSRLLFDSPPIVGRQP
jgi:hypothetical protein